MHRAVAVPKRQHRAITVRQQLHLHVPYQVLEIDPTVIENMDADTSAQVVATQVFTLAGQPVGHLTKGVNILRETLSNGTVRTRKIMVK